MYKVKQGGGLSLLLALVLLSPTATLAQTTVTTEVRSFEILEVDGNYLVVKGDNGTRELTVPPDFRFTVNGKSMAASELKAGMKGTAMITKTTVERPVYVTTVKQGTVVSQTGRSVVIRDEKGTNRRFTQSEVDARGVRLYMNDKPIFVSGLNAGDTVTATIVSAGPPVIVTTQEVNARLAAEPAPAPAVAPAPEPEAAPAPAPEAAPEAAPAPAPEPEATAPAPAPEAAPAPAEEQPKPFFKNPFFMLLALIIIIALIWVLMRRKAKDKK